MGVNISSGRDTNLTAHRDITIQEVTQGQSFSGEDTQKIEKLLSDINEAVKKKDKTAVQTALGVLEKLSMSVASSVTTRLIVDGLSNLLK